MDNSKELQTFNLAEKTAKVKLLTAQTAENIIEIGKTLIEVKENLPYGKFEKWLETDINYSKRTAYNFMKVAKEFPDVQPVAQLGIRKLLALTGLETDDREKVINDNDLESMSSKKVEEVVEEEKMVKKVNKFMERFSHKILPYQRNSKNEIYKDLSDEDIDFLENILVKHYERAENVRNEIYDTLINLKEVLNNDKVFSKWLISIEVIEDFEDLFGGLLDKSITEKKANKGAEQ